MSDLFRRIEFEQSLQDVIGHFDIRKLIEFLMISPDLYECQEIYAYIYDTYGGAMEESHISAASDTVDEIYAAIVNKVASAVKLRYRNDSYIFHRWITPHTAVIGDVYLCPPWEER